MKSLAKLLAAEGRGRDRALPEAADKVCMETHGGFPNPNSRGTVTVTHPRGLVEAQELPFAKAGL